MSKEKTTTRHCGICEKRTANKDYCDECKSRSVRMGKEIKKRLEQKRGYKA